MLQLIKPKSSNKPVKPPSKTKNLLTKFSSACCIFPFYGQIMYWERLLSLLDKECLSVWIKHQNAFINWAAMHNMDIAELDLDQNASYDRHPEHLAYTVNVKTLEQCKRFIKLL